MKFLRVVFAITFLVLVPWFIYANQTQQKFECIAYELSGAKASPVQQVTCMLNGTS